MGLTLAGNKGGTPGLDKKKDNGEGTKETEKERGESAVAVNGVKKRKKQKFLSLKK
jgi:hypothetical protein